MSAAGTRSGTPARWLSIALLALALAELLRECWQLTPQTDDAYISYRYARNLVEGLGLVYNPGEYVEGMTNLFWTLLVAVGIGAGAPAERVGHVLGLAGSAALLTLTWLWARSGKSVGWSAGWAPWLVLSSVVFAYWTTSGMETTLFAAWVTAALVAQARGRPALAAGAAFLASVTRPDGVLVAVAIFAVQLLEGHRREGWRVLRWPLLYGLAMLAVTGWRLVYYGSPVPNTFFAKVGGVPPLRGVYYSLGFFVGGVWLLLLPAALAVFRERLWWPGALYIGLVTAYVVAVGGDAFPYSRFFLPVLPALAVLAVRGAELAWREDRVLGSFAWLACTGFVAFNYFGRYTWSAGVCVLVLALAWAAAAAWQRRRLPWLPAAATVLAGLLLLLDVYPRPELHVGGIPGQRLRGEALAHNHAFNQRLERLADQRVRVLRERGDTDVLVAVSGIGAFGYRSGVRIVDIYGLVDPEIAHSQARVVAPGIPPGHQRSNAGYVMSRKPDYILVPRKGVNRMVSPSTVEIWEHPDFEAYYEWDAPMTGFRRKVGS